MSQQFAFWRTKKRLDSLKVFKRLIVGESVRGLDKLDLDQIEAALIAAFPDWEVVTRRTPNNSQTMLDQGENGGGLDIGYTPQSVIVTCNHTSEKEWNEIIEVMAGLRLPLYDPQINERFDSVPL
jgi:hypothetical protein